MEKVYEARRMLSHLRNTNKLVCTSFFPFISLLNTGTVLSGREIMTAKTALHFFKLQTVMKTVYKNEKKNKIKSAVLHFILSLLKNCAVLPDGLVVQKSIRACHYNSLCQ